MNDQDKNLSVQFFLHPKENPSKTKEAGRPIFDEVEMVSIMAPGNTKTEFTARADRMHYDSNAQRQWTYAERFSEHYRMFKDGIDEQVQGTPISEAPFLPMRVKAEMKAKKISTIEQLANMADRDIKKMGMGFRDHVDQAKAFIETATGTAGLSNEMAELRRQNEGLMQRLSAVEKKDAPAEPVVDTFSQMEPEDLQNMLADAGVTVDKRWGAEKLREKARELAKEAA